MFVIIRDYGTPEARILPPEYRSRLFAERALPVYRRRFPEQTWSVHEFDRVVDRTRKNHKTPYPLRPEVRGQEAAD